MRGISILAVASSLLLSPSAAVSSNMVHGGVYRGPEDTVPPNPGGGSTGRGGGSGPTTPNGPNGPTPPTPGTTPSTGGAGIPTPTGGPRGGRGRPTTSGGVGLGPNLAQWQYWWEFNRDRFLRLKDALYAPGRPTTGTVGFAHGRGSFETKVNLAPGTKDRERIADTLIKLLDGDPTRDIVSSALIGLAKVDGSGKSLPVFERFLAEADQEKRETAAIAMGISGDLGAVPKLLDLARDTKKGRQLVKRAEVDTRTRAFACYGLGLICQKTANLRVKREVFAAMRDMIQTGVAHHARRDLIVAPLQAIRLLRPAGELTDEAVAFLTEFMELPDSKVYAHVRSHAYVALAKLLKRGDAKAATVAKVMAKKLEDRKQKQWIHQSAILALGCIATPDQTEVTDALKWYFTSGKDPQARGFAAIALGQIGGNNNRSFLLQRIRHCKQGYRPWVALGLAVLAHDSRADDYAEADGVIGETILEEFRKTKVQMRAAAMAIALGIVGYKDAAWDIMDRMLAIKHQSEPAGYMAVALGLLREGRAREQIQAVLDGATRRPELLGKCAVALGLLGDKDVAVTLAQRIREPHTVAVYSALARGLGYIGDRRTVRPLIEMATDTKLKQLPRAFAAAALGLIGDTEPMPWNAPLSVDNNYRANVETLTGAGAGVLDIL